MKQVSLKEAFWDYPLSEKELMVKLRRGTVREKAWIIGRIIEHLPYNSIWEYITLSQLQEVFPLLRLRKENKKIWSYALLLWNKHEKTTH